MFRTAPRLNGGVSGTCASDEAHTAARARAVANEHRLADLSAPSVVLRGLDIDAALCRDLCEALGASDVLTALDVGHNRLGDEGATHVAALLSASPNLVSVGLSHNGLSDWGVAAVARAARRRSTVVALDFSANPMGDAALAEVARLVQSSTTLRELVFTDTNVSFQGAVGFAETMLDNHSLQFVSFPFTLGFALTGEIERILRRNWERQRQRGAQVQLAAALFRQAGRLEALRARQWDPRKAAPADGGPGGVRSVQASSLDDWCDEQVAAPLMYLAVLDRKAQLQDEARSERRSVASLVSAVPAASAGVSARGAPRGRGFAASGTAGATRLPPLPLPSPRSRVSR